MAKKLIEKHGTGIVDGKPRLPEAQNLEYGQLAVNYTDRTEAIAFKNVDNEMVTFKSAKQNDETMIKLDNDYFKSYDTINDYNADQNEYPTISWVEEERALKYELEEEEQPYNVIFDTSDPIYDTPDIYIDIHPNNLGIKYLNLNCLYPGFTSSKIFKTFEVDGVEMSDVYEALDSGLKLCYTVDMGIPRKGFLQVNSKPYKLGGNPELENPLFDVLYSIFYGSNISYIEVDESYQKMFYEPTTDTYAFTLGFMNPHLKEVKFIGNWLPKGEAIILSLYGLLTAFNTNDVSLNKRGIKVLIPKDNATYGSLSDSAPNTPEEATFYGVINGINMTLTNNGSPYGVTVETY